MRASLLGRLAQRTARPSPRRPLHAAAPTCRNRILVETAELRTDSTGATRVVLVAGDPRARHVTDVLRAEPGQRIRVGVVDGVRASAVLTHGGDGAWLLDWSAADEAPRLTAAAVDVLLALPRPKVARRLWAPLAALGVGAVFITPAARVEKAYFASEHAEAAAVRAELLRGLEQAGDTRLPPVFLARRFPQVADAAAGRRSWAAADAFGEWLVGSAASLPPPASVLLLAHPGAGMSVTAALREEPGSADGTPRRILVAVGPEGGWTPHELAVLQGSSGRDATPDGEPLRPGARCQLVSMGARTLTTETACVALLAAVKEATDTW
jgi:16S rRNA (uracil1498-N3)-methyltransferase